MKEALIVPIGGAALPIPAFSRPSLTGSGGCPAAFAVRYFGFPELQRSRAIDDFSIGSWGQHNGCEQSLFMAPAPSGHCPFV